MQQQKIMKRVSAAVGTLVLSSSLMVAPSAHAITPDVMAALSGYWTYANLIKEYFEWRGFGGWGTVSTTNIIITAATGQSDGAFTKAVFQGICGSVAAGFVGAWRPPTDPGAASMMKGIMKAGAVNAASSACGWATTFTINRINSEIPKAQAAIDNAQRNNKPNFDEIVDDKTKVNTALLGLEQKYKTVARALTDAAAKASSYRNNRCASPTQSTICADLDRSRRESQSLADAALQSFNSYGRDLSKNIKELGFDVKS